MTIENDFQAAIYAALTGDVALMAVLTGVHDRKPQDTDSGAIAAFPYVTMGEAIFTLLPTDEVTNFSVLLRLHTWSRTGSVKQCKQIQGLMFDILHDADLTITGWNPFSILREESRVIEDPDGQFHGVCEYRALLQKTS